ncbi:MAG: hypothetical protein D6772_10410 [Bacteroidetes bacterium]|nr:MAG: hypothetical protein D6772_10410 [Bacteroidota bacterium]
MRHNLRWVLLFALVLAAYGYSQYRSEHRDATFEAQLLDFDPARVQRIEVKAAGQTPFKLLREANRWLLTYGNVHVEAYPLAVEELLQVLERIRSSEIVDSEVRHWENYGLATTQSTQFCLYDQQASVGCLSFGNLSYSEDRKNLRIFVRLNEGPEVYDAEGLFLSKLASDPRAYRPNLLWLVEGNIEHLDWRTPDTSFWVHRDTNGWHTSSAALATVDWDAYLKNIRYLSGTQFADEFDELRAPELLHWQLQLASLQDTFILHCYRDTTRALPYVYHTGTKPEQWLADDGSELYPSLAAPWLRALQNTETDELE